jgi:hypothetical protein
MLRIARRASFLPSSKHAPRTTTHHAPRSTQHPARSTQYPAPSTLHPAPALCLRPCSAQPRARAAHVSVSAVLSRCHRRGRHSRGDVGPKASPSTLSTPRALGRRASGPDAPPLLTARLSRPIAPGPAPNIPRLPEPPAREPGLMLLSRHHHGRRQS